METKYKNFSRDGENHTVDMDEELKKYTNKFIKKITDNLENFHYNVIIANLYQMYNFLNKEVEKKYKKETLFENYRKILISINPILPHFSNECLELIGHNKKLEWPSYDKKYLEKNIVSIVVQINGKKRGLININRDSEESELINTIQKK